MPRRPRRARWLVLVVVVLALLGAGGYALFWRPSHDTARIEAARAARIACSCRYVGGRALGDCDKDVPKGRFSVTLSEDAPAHSVSAHVAMGVAQTATYREGWGCQLPAWRTSD